MRPALGSQESPRSGLKYSKQKVVARTGSPEVNLFSQTSNEQPQICSGPVGTERQWALELGTPPGDGGAPAHGPEFCHWASTRGEAQPGFGKHPEHGAGQHPAPGRKQSSSADQEKVGTESGGELGAEIGASAADLHRTVLPWVRLFRRQDAKRLEDANRL